MKEELLKQVLFNPAMNMTAVQRYGCTRLAEPENLAVHVAEASMMSYIIASKLKSLGQEVNIGLLLEKCLVHDIDEVITGDIVRNLKYATPEIHEGIEKVACSAVNKVSELIEGATELTVTWERSKLGVEGLILKLVDMLCVVRKAMTEVELYNNLAALKIISELKNHLVKLSSVISNNGDLNNESSNYLINLIIEAVDEVNGLYYTHSKIIEKYSINENILEG